MTCLLWARLTQLCAHFSLRNPPVSEIIRTYHLLHTILKYGTKNKWRRRFKSILIHSQVSQTLGNGSQYFSFSVAFLPKQWLSFKRRGKKNINPSQFLGQQKRQMPNNGLDHPLELPKLPTQVVPGKCQGEGHQHSLCQFPPLPSDRLENLGGSVQAD